MVRKIIWSPEAIDTYISIIEYLEKEWTEREVRNFMLRVHEKLGILSQQPLIGRLSSKKRNNYRTLINKHTTLVYHYKPIKKEIELVSFWNNAQDPRKLKF